MDNRQLLQFFAKFIETQTGITYSEGIYYQLENRLQTIAKQLGYASLDELAEAAVKNGITGTMKEQLIDLATNNETLFFRDNSLFEALTKGILPALAQTVSDAPCRIWSAASSTGQEIYSVCMLLHEMQSTYPHARWELTASDISERVLAKASKGMYTPLEVQRGLTPQRLANYFDETKDEANDAAWQIKAFLRKMINFRRLNLIEKWPISLGSFNLILCRNVLIYQTVDQKRAVIQQLAKHLRPGGLLILGGSESLIGLSNDFDQEEVLGTFVYRIKSSALSQAS